MIGWNSAASCPAGNTIRSPQRPSLMLCGYTYLAFKWSAVWWLCVTPYFSLSQWWPGLMLAWAICGACSGHTVSGRCRAWDSGLVSLPDGLPCFLMALFVLCIFLTAQLQEESLQPQTLPGCSHRQNKQQGHFQKWQHSLQVCGRMYWASGKVGAGG